MPPGSATVSQESSPLKRPGASVFKSKLFLLLLGFLFFLSIYLIRIREDMADFEVNYRAGERLIAGEALYRTEDGHFMFKYLPFSALLYAPFTLLPLDVAKAVWYALLVVCAVAAFALSHKLVYKERLGPPLLAIFPPLILAKFFFREMKLGQINILVTVILLLMVWSLAKRDLSPFWRETKAGLLWGVASALKPYGLIFLPYFLVKKQWKALGIGLGFILLAACLPTFFYGVQGNVDLLRNWLSTLSQSTPSLFVSNDNVSIVALWVKWGGDPALAMRFWSAATVIVGCGVLAVIRRGENKEASAVLECSFLLTLVPLISPMGWDYQLLMSVLAVTLVVYHFFEFPKFWRVFLIVNFCVISLTVYDIMGRDLYRSFMASSVLTLCFLLFLGYVGYLRFRRVC